MNENKLRKQDDDFKIIKANLRAGIPKYKARNLKEELEYRILQFTGFLWVMKWRFKYRHSFWMEKGRFGK